MDRPSPPSLSSTLKISLSSLMIQMVKNRPTMWETPVGSLSWEDSLEKEMATYSRWDSLARRIPWTEESGGLQSMGSQRVRHDWVALTHYLLACIASNDMCYCSIFVHLWHFPSVLNIFSSALVFIWLWYALLCFYSCFFLLLSSSLNL